MMTLVRPISWVILGQSSELNWMTDKVEVYLLI